MKRDVPGRKVGVGGDEGPDTERTTASPEEVRPVREPTEMGNVSVSTDLRRRPL